MKHAGEYEITDKIRSMALQGFLDLKEGWIARDTTRI